MIKFSESGDFCKEMESEENENVGLGMAHVPRRGPAGSPRAAVWPGPEPGSFPVEGAAWVPRALQGQRPPGPGLPSAARVLPPDPRCLWERAPSPGCSPAALPERHLDPERPRMVTGFVSLWWQLRSAPFPLWGVPSQPGRLGPGPLHSSLPAGPLQGSPQFLGSQFTRLPGGEATLATSAEFPPSLPVLLAV